MNYSECNRVVLVGNARIAKQIWDFLVSEKTNKLLSYIYYDNVGMKATALFLDGRRVDCEIDLLDYLNLQKENVLVINANAYYIYPDKLVQKENMRIINNHYGFIPEYRGRNICSWVIFNQELYTGVVWHDINTEIDMGTIVKQAKLKIGLDEKAYELLIRQMKEALILFKEWWNEWKGGNEVVRQVSRISKGRMFHSWDWPNFGVIDLRTDEIERIYRTLRAMDYGKITGTKLTTLIDYNGKKYQVIKYQKIKKHSKNKSNGFYLNMEGEEELEIIVRSMECIK